MREIQELFDAAAWGKKRLPLVRPAARLSDIAKLLATEYSPLMLAFSGHTKPASSLVAGGGGGGGGGGDGGGGGGGNGGSAPAAAAPAASMSAAANGASSASNGASSGEQQQQQQAQAPTFVDHIVFELEADDPHATPHALRYGQQSEPTTDAMIRLLSPSLAPELKGIILNACKTETMARLIQRDLPNLAIVCWRSIVEDRAAKAFSRGFYSAIAAGAEGAVSVHRAFDAGRAAFLRAGFCEGDPADYLHEPSHDHVVRRVFVRSCPGCKPPVHGQPILVAKPRL